MKKKNKIILWTSGIIMGLLFAGLIGYTTYSFIANSFTMTTKVEQVEQQQLLDVSWDTSTAVARVEITVTHESRIVSKTTIVDVQTLHKGETQVFGHYGVMNIEVKAYKGTFNTVTKRSKVAMFADEYNIAPLSGTMPVTILSLHLPTIDDIPTFGWFSRSGAWNWSDLPDNVYPIPVADYDEFFEFDSIEGHTTTNMFNKTNAWIKELYEINPDSKFNLYYNEYHSYAALEATVGNGLSRDNYHTYLLSEGAGTTSVFNNIFNENEDGKTNSGKTVDELYNQMKAEFNKTVGQVEKSGSYGFVGYEIFKTDMKQYSFIYALEDPNTEIWMTRVDTLTTSSELYDKIANSDSVLVKDLNTMLNSLEETEKETVQQLYNFSDHIFEQAVTENKKVMVILGTWTQNEFHFEEYVKFTKEYYGDDYVYYYKGHPKNPTQIVDGKQENLDSLGLIDIDATIAAEIIYFFNPDIYLTGYGSTTFMSVPNEHALTVWNSTKEETHINYKDVLDSFISYIDDNTYDSIINKENKNFLIEYNINVNYDFSIFDSKTLTIKNYKNENGVFTEV